MREFIILLTAISVILLHFTGAQAEFKINNSPENIEGPFSLLGMEPYRSSVSDAVLDNYRSGYNSKYPGHYFQPPFGIRGDSLSYETALEIKNLLLGLADSTFYDDFVIKNIKEYRYKLNYDKIERREYFIRYSRNDTIFVISGWLSKFLSFYISIPIDKQHHIMQSISELNALAQTYVRDINSNSRSEFEKDFYFFELTSKKTLLRFRNYKIYEVYLNSEKVQDIVRKPYNLIEITKFLDKEMIP